MSTLIDLGLAVVVVLSLLAGLKSGLVDSVFSLASWVVGGLVAFRVSSPVLAQLPARFQNLPGALLLTGVLLFLVTYFVIRMIGSLVGGSSKEGATGLDRFFGTLFGLARGVFLAAAVASFLVGYLPQDSRFIRGSRALPYLSSAGRVVAGLAPASIRSRMDRGWERLRAAPEQPAGGAIEA
jgi:membrane protein required for colicin V production